MLFAHSAGKLQILKSVRLMTRALCSSSRSDSDSSDDERTPRHELKPSHAKNSEALNKLNILLQSMVKQEKTPEAVPPLEAQLARPKRFFKKKEEAEKENKTEQMKKPGDESATAMENAALDVAQMLGGDVSHTESELLNKLRSHSEAASAINLSELIAGMKIDRSKKPAPTQEVSRAQQVRQALGQKLPQQHSSRPPAEEKRLRRPSPARVNLFGGDPLGIFLKETVMPNEVPAEPQLETWAKLRRREMRIAITHPPANYFQEMILWTEQGKIWKFPIDNEQGMEEEAKVPFEDHVFLERYLEPWCPRRGPVRHFMELVCVGLSKNCFVTAEEKRRHIEWYRDYFATKEAILKEVGAI